MARLHVSASALRLLESCPRAWFYRYVCGGPAEETSAAQVLGRAMHAALAIWFERWRDGLAEVNAEEMLPFARGAVSFIQSRAFA